MSLGNSWENSWIKEYLWASRFVSIGPWQVELSQLNADYSSKTRRMKRYKHLWQRMDPIVNTAASSAAAAGPDVQPWQVPSLLQRAAMLETWAEERSVNAGHQQTGSEKSELTGPPERKSFKFGSGSKCGCARSAHAFSANSSAERRGQAYVICNRWFRFDALGERLCWEMQKASGSELKKFPKFQKQKYGDSSWAWWVMDMLTLLTSETCEKIQVGQSLACAQ